MIKNNLLSPYILILFLGGIFTYSYVNFNRSDLVLEIRKKDSVAHIKE